MKDHLQRHDSIVVTRAQREIPHESQLAPRAGEAVPGCIPREGERGLAAAEVTPCTPYARSCLCHR
ncbi:hypothetical protein GCM10010298_02630 [Streptomyces microflavus]|uniref:Uncharacterized protein n=1 Tax=Streptomyces microflavus TaxID=1919 RepID=A0A7J0CNJ4_STRMI|nr:hypothetical protein Smic_26160 [Streptomyces microflavus]GGX43145.1 hypothetical protein GCM10010298_02630 [Streptomyces microflavus]